MNDFTKTDLTEILRCLKYMTKGGTTPYSYHTIALVKKVRDMIETYHKKCDHKSTNYDDGIYYCDDCGMCVK